MDLLVQNRLTSIVHIHFILDVDFLIDEHPIPRIYAKIHLTCGEYRILKDRNVNTSMSLEVPETIELFSVFIGVPVHIDGNIR